MEVFNWLLSATNKAKTDAAIMLLTMGWTP